MYLNITLFIIIYINQIIVIYYINYFNSLIYKVHNNIVDLLLIMIKYNKYILI